MARSDFLTRFIAVLRSSLLWSVVFLWLLLLFMETARPHYFLHDDNATWFIGAYLHDYRVLTETGRFAVVNYYQHGGEPFLQQGQTAVLYPPVYLGVALAKAVSGDTIWTIDWIAAIHLTLGLIGFYFWLRQGGVAGWMAALGGLAWVLNPFVLDVGDSWIMVTYVAAWLPWIFWSFDLLLVRPSFRAALFLGGSTGLLFLQGYAQWFASAALFLVFYALFQFIARPATRQRFVYFYLVVSMLVFAIFSLPLLLPMLYALADSAIRADPLNLEVAIGYAINMHDVYVAQTCAFETNLAFGMSNAILFCPALVFLPVVAVRIWYADPEMRRRLLGLALFGLLGILFSTRWHALISVLPLYDRFRWPFKVFIFADFFLIAALAWTVASWTKSRGSVARNANFTAGLCLSLVVFANIGISLGFHDANSFSKTLLPSSTSPLPSRLDSKLGRVITIGDGLVESESYHYYTHAYATYFAFPSLGGYNPLVGRETLVYSRYLDFPNVCTDKVDAEFQKRFEALSVRYWIVDPHSSHFPQVKSLDGLTQLEVEPNRVIIEDPQAAPLVFAEAKPSIPCAITYSGNSILVAVSGVKSPISVSLGPTDGWWYRVDGGWWLRGDYQDGRLIAEFPASAKVVEVSYIDARFREGVTASAWLILVLVLLLMAQRVSPMFRKNREN